MNTKTTTYLTTALILAGFLLIVLGWNGAASTRFVDAQLPYIVSGGLAGVGLVVAGCTLAIVQELRKTAASIAQAMERSTAVGRGEAADPLQDTLPEPRSGSSIEREPAVAE